ncbi:MAG: NADH-quinone oxidoreductase subunit L [Candidatus Binatia bacterium]
MELAQPFFHIDPLATVVGLSILFFTGLTLLYSPGYMPKATGRTLYYVYIVLTLVAALGAVLANNLIVFLVGWGLTGVFLYLLIGYGSKERVSATAQKAMIVLGGTEAFMMLGVALMGQLGGSFTIQHISRNPISLAQPLAVPAFLCLLIGVLAKAGAIPLHTWLVDTAEDAPTPVTAFLPAAVDKLLGIYLLVRMSLDLFVMIPVMYTALLVIGAITIVGAGMMMLTQQDCKRLLGYCAVSQVGYILLGLGSGHPLGIAGGLFHMVNHTIYKSCLFFSLGAVEHKTQTTDVERVGGMGSQLPLIFVSFLIAALSVSGIPPLNGFASKWMIYQGLIEAGKAGGTTWILWLVVAMFGSALTLAGTMKVTHAIFLGQAPPEPQQIPDTAEKTPVAMLIPPLLLAFLCLVFGIWTYAIPLRHLIFPILGQEIAFPGMWQPTLATVLIIVGIGFGFLLYVGGRATLTLRQTDVFIGGETLDVLQGMRLSGGDFYNTIQELPVFRLLYGLAQSRAFDVYHSGAFLAFGLHRVFRSLHTGILSTYVSWCLLGLGILFGVLVLR